MEGQNPKRKSQGDDSSAEIGTYYLRNKIKMGIWALLAEK